VPECSVAARQGRGGQASLVAQDRGGGQVGHDRTLVEHDGARAYLADEREIVAAITIVAANPRSAPSERRRADRAEDGSSSSSRPGRHTNAPARHTRRFSPSTGDAASGARSSKTDGGQRLAHGARHPHPSQRRAAARRPRLRHRQPDQLIVGSWNTIPTSSRMRPIVRPSSASPTVMRRPGRAGGVAARFVDVQVGRRSGSNPARCRSSVDLPAPFGPSSAHVRPPHAECDAVQAGSRPDNGT